MSPVPDKHISVLCVDRNEWQELQALRYSTASAWPGMHSAGAAQRHGLMLGRFAPARRSRTRSSRSASWPARPRRRPRRSTAGCRSARACGRASGCGAAPARRPPTACKQRSGATDPLAWLPAHLLEDGAHMSKFCGRQLQSAGTDMPHRYSRASERRSRLACSCLSSVARGCERHVSACALRFAWEEAKTALLRLCQRFTFKLEPGQVRRPVLPCIIMILCMQARAVPRCNMMSNIPGSCMHVPVFACCCQKWRGIAATRAAH